MSDILVFSEQENVSLELLSRAREMGSVAVVLLGKNNPKDYDGYGAEQVYVSDAPNLADVRADVYADALAQVANLSSARIVLLGSTKRGKELAGRLAQRLGCGVVTDAIALLKQDGQIQTKRYALGGNTISTNVIATERQVIAVMPGTFQATPCSPADVAAAKVVHLDLELRESRVQIVERRAKAARAVDIQGAERLVAVGKGLAKREDLAMIEKLAQALKAEIGCTRALSSDYHWLGEERTIGISGKICKPQLLVSVGISGQIQHTVGIRGSKWIVAINKDKNAPIFNMTDYGIVADLSEVVPKLTERIIAGGQREAIR